MKASIKNIIWNSTLHKIYNLLLQSFKAPNLHKSFQYSDREACIPSKTELQQAVS